MSVSAGRTAGPCSTNSTHGALCHCRFESWQNARDRNYLTGKKHYSDDHSRNLSQECINVDSFYSEAQ
jgi:hypothetical protein